MPVKLINLTVSYSRHPAIHHISGEFASASLTAVVGPNGAGKSTLLKAIAEIMRPSTGHIEFGEIAADEIAYLPQAAQINKDFPLTVLQMVTLGYWAKTKGLHSISAQLREKAKYALATVGLSEFEERYIGTLSAGQFQRLLFARLMLQDAKLILLDEPFTAIDSETTAKLLEIIKTWNREKRTVICVLHDLNQVHANFPDCLLLARKCISWGKTKTVLAEENLFKAKLFHEAWQENAELCKA
jgi:zinc/manganese transport system ATP-binding protein